MTTNEIQYFINGEEYVTRPQIANQFPISFFDSLRWLEKIKSVVKYEKIGKIIYYKRSDIEEQITKREINRLRKEIKEKSDKV